MLYALQESGMASDAQARAGAPEHREKQLSGLETRLRKSVKGVIVRCILKDYYPNCR